jgi:hypothetical protein
VRKGTTQDRIGIAAISSQKLTVSPATAVLDHDGVEGAKAEAERAKQLTTAAANIMV